MLITAALGLLPATGTLFAQSNLPGPDRPGDELFTFPPETPQRLVRAAELAVGLRRPGLARGYLRTLLDRPLTDVDALQLRKDYGPRFFLGFSANPELHPEAKELLDRINQAVELAAAPDASLSQLVDQLGTGHDAAVDAALQLLAQGDSSVQPLLNADTTTASGRMADRLLHRYSNRLQRGLTDALVDAPAETQVRILKILERSAAGNMAPELLVYQFASDSTEVRLAAQDTIDRLWNGHDRPNSATAAVEFLTTESTQLLWQAGQSYSSHTGATAHWNNEAWDSEANLTDYQALMQRAAVLSRAALTIDPRSSDAMNLATVCESTLQAWPASWPVSTTPSGGNSTASDSDAMLVFTALQSENAAAMLAVLQMESVQSSVTTLQRQLVTQTLNHPDPRVRLLAAAYVLNGTGTAAHRRTAESVIDSAQRGKEQPQAVVIDSRNSEAQTVASILEDLNFAATAATTGQTGVAEATKQLNCELIMIHGNCLSSSLSNTVANLRADRRTRNTPIIIYGAEYFESAAASLAKLHSGIWYLQEPLSADTLRDSLRLEHVTPPLLTIAERAAMINFASQIQTDDN